MATAADIMTRKVVTTKTDRSVWDAARMLLDKGYGGMPVVDSDGKLIGMVSGFDVISKTGKTVGEIMRYVDGPIAPVDCVSQSRQTECAFHGECHFFGFWGRVRQAISDVVDRTTFADLVRENRERKRGYVGDWII